MRRIMVMNSKGGCGKSTLATNLAAYYALEGAKVTLADFDPQGSSLDWLAGRPEDQPEIVGLTAYDDGLWGVVRGTDYLIMDTPARTHGPELTKLVRRADTIVVPVLPSPIDIQACESFVEELLELGAVQREEVDIALVANRVRENTVIFEQLEDFLEQQDVSYVGVLREAQNYIRAYTRGLGIFELPEYLAWPDWEQWEPLLEWLNGGA